MAVTRCGSYRLNRERSAARKTRAVEQAIEKFGEAMIAWHALLDHPTPLKARAPRDRLRRLTALTGAVWPAVLTAKR